MAQAFGATPFGALEEQVRRNMEMFEQAFAMFTPFARREEDAERGGESRSKPASGDIDELKRQLEEMQRGSTSSATRMTQRACAAIPRKREA